MADILTTLATNYRTVGDASNYSQSKYVNVDPAKYEGSWTGKYANNQSFEIQVSNVQGFRAKVRYSSGGVVKYQDVLIRDSAFRVADSKFSLTNKDGTAQVRTVLTNASSGQTLETAYAKQS